MTTGKVLKDRRSPRERGRMGGSLTADDDATATARVAAASRSASCTICSTGIPNAPVFPLPVSAAARTSPPPSTSGIASDCGVVPYEATSGWGSQASEAELKGIEGGDCERGTLGGETRREKSLRIGVHHADAVVWEPVTEEEEETEEERAFLSARVARRLAERAGDNSYVATLLREPFWASRVLSDPRLRRLFAGKKAHKEVTEAFAAAAKTRALIAALDATSDDQASVDGAGWTIFDACSGKGVAAILYSFWFPRAKIVMLDADGAMDLTHVRARANVTFRHVDLYGESVVEAIRDECGDGDASDATSDATSDTTSDVCGRSERSARGGAILVGVHLCGALSPRLIDLAFGLDEIRGLVLCPCCVKGTLGRDCVRSGKERGVGAYVVLCETFRALCEREICIGGGDRGGGFVRIAADEDVMSPVNCFITVAKPHGGGGLCEAC